MSFTQEQFRLLTKVEKKLNSVHRGTLGPACFLLTLFDEAALRAFLAEATVLQPATIRFNVGDETTRHRDIMEHAYGTPGVTAYVGFRLLHCDHGYQWVLNSWIVDANGVLFDVWDETYMPLFVGMPYPKDILRQALQWRLDTPISHQATA